MTEIFHLMTYSTHFIYSYVVSDIMVKDQRERGNLLPPYRLLFLISDKGSFIYTIPQTGITPTTTIVTPFIDNWLEQEIAE